MHELGIADSILDAVRQEAESHSGLHVRAVGLRLGRFAGVDPDALRFCFESLLEDSGLEPLALELELIPRRHRCPACELEFEVNDYDFICPRCGAWSSDCVAGLEMEIDYMELEELCRASR